MSLFTCVYHFYCNLKKFKTFLLLTDSLTLTRPRGAFAPKNVYKENRQLYCTMYYLLWAQGKLMLEGKCTVQCTSYLSVSGGFYDNVICSW